MSGRGSGGGGGGGEEMGSGIKWPKRELEKIGRKLGEKGQKYGMQDKSICEVTGSIGSKGEHFICLSLLSLKQEDGKSKLRV